MLIAVPDLLDSIFSEELQQLLRVILGRTIRFYNQEHQQNAFEDVYDLILCCVQLNVCKLRFSLHYHGAILQASYCGYFGHVNHVKTETVRITASGCRRCCFANVFGVLAYGA